MSTIRHRGIKQERARDLMPERIFAEMWEEENRAQSGINFGYGALELILNTLPLSSGPWDWQPPIDGITQRDATVAATVIQWLGTQCGAAFVMRVEQRIEAERVKEMLAFNERWNKPQPPAR